MTVARQKLGVEGERLAEAFLVAQGYRVLARRFRALRAEIDLVCADGATFVFVEVKTRRTARFGHAVLAVTEKKLQQMAVASEIWLRRQGKALQPRRFDVVTVMWAGSVPTIEHWKAVG